MATTSTGGSIWDQITGVISGFDGVLGSAGDAVKNYQNTFDSEGRATGTSTQPASAHDDTGKDDKYLAYFLAGGAIIVLGGVAALAVSSGGKPARSKPAQTRTRTKKS